MSRINSPFVSPAPAQANPGFNGAPRAANLAPEKPRELGPVAVWIVLIVGLLVVADLLVARAGHVWTAVVIGLLCCVFLAMLVNNTRPAKDSAPSPADGSASEKPV